MFSVRLCNSLLVMVFNENITFENLHKNKKESPTATIDSIPPVLHFGKHLRQYRTLCKFVSS